MPRRWQHRKLRKDLAEKASSAKSRYLTGISHELRTPLQSILGYAQILQKNLNRADDYRDFIKEKEGKRLTAYPDADGFSIGFGRYGANEGDTITDQQAEEYLEEDINTRIDAINLIDESQKDGSIKYSSIRSREQLEIQVESETLKDLSLGLSRNI